MSIEEWCTPDGCPATICGGPHLAVKTTLGTEIVRVGQATIGRLIDEDSGGAE